MNATSVEATALRSLLDAYTDRHAAAHAWKAGGGKVIGYVSTAVPRELITAAGMFPLLITGDPARVTTRGDKWMEEQFDPMARSIFDAAVSGELAFLDLLIVPRVADSFLRLYLYLREIERTGAAPGLPRLQLFDLLQTRHYSSGAYNVERVRDLRGVLESIGGHALTDAALSAAIESANQGRALIRKFTARRHAPSPTMPGSQVLQLIGAANLLRADDFLSHATAAASANDDQPPVTGSQPRIVVAGNAQDTAVLSQLLEAQGFAVVGDYHWLGDVEASKDVATSIDPWLAIADHYHHESLTSRRFPHQPQELVEYARSVQAAGVVFYLFEAEEALTWDTPGQVTALNAAGIATTVLIDQPYLPVATRSLLEQLRVLQSQIEAPTIVETAPT